MLKWVWLKSFPSLLLSIHLSSQLSFYPSFLPSIHPFICPSFLAFIYSSLHPSILPYIYIKTQSRHGQRVFLPSFFLSIHPSIHLSFSAFIFPSIHPSYFPSIHLEIWWLWRPYHMIYITFNLTKPFSEPSCPVDWGGVILEETTTAVLMVISTLHWFAVNL